MEGILWFFGFIIVAAIAVGIFKGYAQNMAKVAYQHGLERLKADPTNADLRTEVLDLGRAYSNLCRDSKGVTIFYEVAIKNDLDAATAGMKTTVVKESDPVPSVVAPSIEDRLARVDGLL